MFMIQDLLLKQFMNSPLVMRCLLNVLFAASYSNVLWKYAMPKFNIFVVARKNETYILHIHTLQQKLGAGMPLKWMLAFNFCSLTYMLILLQCHESLL